MTASGAPWSSVRLGAVTDPGAAYDHNEDCFQADPAIGLYILADGVGGAAAGEVASALAVQTVLQRLTAGREPPGERLLEAVLAAHLAIRRAAEAEPSQRGMGSTILIAWAFHSPDVLWTAHVGNCRAYRLRSGRLDLLTEDHTILNELRLAGQLPPDRARWPRGNILSQSLGMIDPVAPDVREWPLEAGDLVFLCSDGVSDVLDDETIQQVLEQANDPEAICREIADLVVRRGAPDNLTALALQFLPD